MKDLVFEACRDSDNRVHVWEKRREVTVKSRLVGVFKWGTADDGPWP